MPETVAVPGAVPVNVTEQLPAVNPQVRALRLPPVVPADRVNVTVPVGVIAVPAAEVSVTVAVHVDGLKPTVDGAQLTAMAEVLTVTVIVLLVPGPLPL